MVVFKRIIFCVAFLSAFFSFSQEEKRLALVIGNSNYEKGELKNPVNDAKLIARTLDSLNFDVIEAYNIETQRDLIDIIKKFGIKRDSADIGFVYYAGHGIQINNENFLLPTKEDYRSESDVEDYAVSVQKIMRVLESKTDQVNILILDACRDNPFESSWQKTRSRKGQGLAKLPPPTGSLIAFSTDSGQTAPDGEGENSIYTMSLSKNMLLEQTSIDQVFRNVRAEVLSESNGEQRPIEATQLTGKAFYLNPSDYTKIYKEVESILDQEDGDLLYALSLIEPVIKNTNELEANLLKARIYNGLKEYQKSETEFLNLIPLDSLNPEVYVRYAELLVDKEDFKKSIKFYSKSITIDSTKAFYYYDRALPYEALGMYVKAEEDYLKAIDKEPLVEKAYNSLADLYEEQLNEPEKAIAKYLKALEINPVSSSALNSIGVTYQNKLNNNKKAEEYYLMASEVDSINPYPLYNLANFYNNQKLYQKAIEFYSNAIAIDSTEVRFYINRASTFENLERYNKAEKDYLKSIELGPKDKLAYYNLGDLYEEHLNEPEKAIAQYLKILEINPESSRALNSIGVTYQNKLKNDIKAEEYYLMASEVDSMNAYPLANLANFYNSQELYKKSIIFYSKAIAIDSTKASYYFYRRHPYVALEMFDKAEEDILKSIELDPKTERFYAALGDLFRKQLNKPEKGIDQYLKALKINPQSSRILNRIGNAYIDLNNNKKAEEYYLKSSEVDYLNPWPFNNLGVFYNRQELYQKAIESYSKAIEIDSNEVTFYFNRAFPYEALEMYNKAEKDYLKSIDLYPEYENNHLYLGDLYLEQLNETEKAIAQYLKILEINPESSRAFNRIGDAYVKSYRNEKAEEYYFKAIKVDSLNPYTFKNLGVFYQNQNSHEKAIQYYSKAIEIDSTEIYFYYNRTTPYEYLEMYDKAEADYLKVIELEPDLESIYLDLGDFYKNKLNDYEKSKNQYNKALKFYDSRISLEPNNAIHYLEKGNIFSKYLFDFKNGLKWIKKANDIEQTSFSLISEAIAYINLKKFSLAEQKLKNANELKPYDYDIYYYLANLYHYTQKPKDAQAFLNKAISLNDRDPSGHYLYAMTLLNKKDYLNAFLKISSAIDRHKSDRFLIPGEDFISELSLEDLYLKRAEIANLMLGKNKNSCEDYDTALSLTKEPEKKKEIELLISQNCNQ